MNVTGPLAAKVRLKVQWPLASVVAVPTGEAERTPFFTVNRRIEAFARPGTYPPLKVPTLPLAEPTSDSAGCTEMTVLELDRLDVMSFANRRVFVRGETVKLAWPLASNVPL